MKEFIEWISRHKIIVTFMCVFLIVGGPAIIHIIFSVYPENNFFVAKWSAGDMLQYYVAVLSMFPTTLLSIAALRFSIYAKEDDDRRTRKVNIVLEREKYIKLSWDKGLKHLEIPFINCGEAIPEYVTIESVDILPYRNMFEAVKIKEPRNAMGHIESTGEKEFKLDIALYDNDLTDFINNIVKIWEHFRRGLLTKEEYLRNTSLCVILNIGIYSGKIVTPIRICVYIQSDLNYQQKNYYEIGYNIQEHNIYTGSPLTEVDYEKQWK